MNFLQYIVAFLIVYLCVTLCLTEFVSVSSTVLPLNHTPNSEKTELKQIFRKATKRKEKAMWRRELMKNKLYAVAIIFLGALSVPIEWDITLFLFALMVGLALFFAKENWIL